uniref:Transmembrane protein n=1 Tax=Chromera velia CCMP2878 TaxID=1169474 RepID=A0A0G4I680_9ALVE|eukprot:Cvel_1885.t1-p1 / transcript=Cvel_1885.t1 / gene=Cvel_1885 / organism=Chromera_velia_CCMP2878 / gene_product=hypothetical protein / transcript_product=hypothetical protein / location=Cvel_scaffold70:97609-102848(-) / protein_length=750 / sequence_SO=supercontig / SO=protein_coding / is_pseudo=false
MSLWTDGAGLKVPLEQFGLSAGVRVRVPGGDLKLILGTRSSGITLLSPGDDGDGDGDRLSGQLEWCDNDRLCDVPLDADESLYKCSHTVEKPKDSFFHLNVIDLGAGAEVVVEEGQAVLPSVSLDCEAEERKEEEEESGTAVEVLNTPVQVLRRPEWSRGEDWKKIVGDLGADGFFGLAGDALSCRDTHSFFPSLLSAAVAENKDETDKKKIELKSGERSSAGDYGIEPVLLGFDLNVSLNEGPVGGSGYAKKWDVVQEEISSLLGEGDDPQELCSVVSLSGPLASHIRLSNDSQSSLVSLPSWSSESFVSSASFSFPQTKGFQGKCAKKEKEETDRESFFNSPLTTGISWLDFLFGLRKREQFYLSPSSSDEALIASLEERQTDRDGWRRRERGREEEKVTGSEIGNEEEQVTQETARRLEEAEEGASSSSSSSPFSAGSIQIGGSIPELYRDRMIWSERQAGRSNPFSFMSYNWRTCGVAGLNLFSSSWIAEINTGEEGLVLPHSLLKALESWIPSVKCPDFHRGKRIDVVKGCRVEKKSKRSGEDLPFLLFDLEQMGNKERGPLVLPLESLVKEEKDEPDDRLFVSEHMYQDRSVNGHTSGLPIRLGSLAMKSFYWVVDEAGHPGSVGLANKDAGVTHSSRTEDEKDEDRAKGTQRGFQVSLGPSASCAEPAQCRGAQTFFEPLNLCLDPPCTLFWFRSLNEKEKTCDLPSSAFQGLSVFLGLLVVAEIAAFFFYRLVASLARRRCL